jgi:putative component of membrane protein insertase Oxa1/YidC/SpoIIIJ protein YidD
MNRSERGVRRESRLAAHGGRTSLAPFVLVVLGLGVLAGAPAGADPPPGRPSAADTVGSSSSNPAGWATGFYQAYISPLRHGHCQFTPSCSEYAARAIGRYGPVKGPALAMDRLMRCNGSARRYYARAADGRLIDKPSGGGRSRYEPRVPLWLIPELETDPPPGADYSAGPEKALGTTGGAGTVGGPPPAPATGETVSFARDLSARGDCFRAGTEYLRAAHLAGAAPWWGWAQLQIGACYFAEGDWSRAEEAYLEAGRMSETGVQKHLATYMTAVCRFNAGKYASCRRLLRLESGGSDGDPVGDGGAPLLLGLSDLTLGDWGGAKRAFAEGGLLATDPTRGERAMFLVSRAASGPDVPRRSEALAAAMSIVLPGSGQIYAGRPQDGLRHLIFNGALIYTTVKLLQDEHYPAAYLVASLEFPFYLGNVLGAGRSAAAYNRDRCLEFTTRSIELANRR